MADASCLLCFNLNILQVQVLNAYSSDDDAVGEGCGPTEVRCLSGSSSSRGKGSQGFYESFFFMVYRVVNSLCSADSNCS